MTSALPHRCSDCSVRDSALCSAMRDEELGELSAIGRRRVWPAGQVVAWSGDPNTLFSNIVSGTLKITASTEDGREQIVGLLHAGDFAGQPFADDSELTITALTDSDLCMYPRTGFERVLGDHPRMERMMLERTMETLKEARQRMLSLARRSAQERIAAFLLELHERAVSQGEDDGAEILIPLSRGEMADLLGLTIETVSRQFTRLKSMGVISFEKGGRSCTILSVERLDALANPDE